MMRPDLRIVFLERAAARLRLFNSADMTIDEAIGGLIEPFEEIIGRRMLCDCAREMVERWNAKPPRARRAA